MNQLRSIIFAAVFLATLLQSVASVVVARKAATIRKPLRVQQTGEQERKLSPSFNIFRRSTEDNEASSDQRGSFGGLIPTELFQSGYILISSAAEQTPQESGNQEKSMPPTNQDISNGKGGESNGVAGVSMMIIGMEEPSPKQKLRKAFGSSAPASLALDTFGLSTGSPFDQQAEEANKIISTMQNMIIEQQITDGIAQAIGSMLDMSMQRGMPSQAKEPNQPPAREANKPQVQTEAHSAKAKEKTAPAETETDKPPTTTATLPAEVPGVSYSQPAPREPSAFTTPNVGKQILLSDSRTFDNTSHHSQL